MILTIDIGNTTVCLCGVTRDGAGGYEVAFRARLDTRREQGTEAYREQIAACLAEVGAAPRAFEGAALSSVVPCLAEPVTQAVRALTGREVVPITHDTAGELRLAIPEPTSLGLDRVVDAAWACASLPLPAITVDMGTATTFNVIDRDRNFRGGAIAPGLETGLRALSARAAQLPEIELTAPEHVIGTCTPECMLSGSVVAAAAMIDGMASRIERELGEPASLVITGGLARLVAPLCEHPHIYDPDLLPKGLALLYDQEMARR
jgi:type III pantothenate kinase